MQQGALYLNKLTMLFLESSSRRSTERVLLHFTDTVLVFKKLSFAALLREISWPPGYNPMLKAFKLLPKQYPKRYVKLLEGIQKL